MNPYTDRDYLGRDALPRRGGVVALVTYFVVVALSLWFVRCDSSEIMPEEDLSQGSIVISLGNSDEGSGELPTEETPPEVAPPLPPEEEVTPEEILTDESSPIEEPSPPEVEPIEEEVVETVVREVNKRALFPGAAPTPTDSEPTQGNNEQSRGVVGSERGTMEQASELGSGLSGDFSLSGRSLIGSLPTPDYEAQEEGRVVINITVDEAGHVTSASIRTDASNTNSSKLIAAAREAALKARFSTSESFIQSGTITYVFKLN